MLTLTDISSDGKDPSFVSPVDARSLQFVTIACSQSLPAIAFFRHWSFRILRDHARSLADISGSSVRFGPHCGNHFRERTLMSA